MGRRILITGYPSVLLARRLLRTVLAHSAEDRVTALVAKGSLNEAEADLGRLSDEQRERVSLLVGECSDMDFGLSGRAFMDLARSIDVIHHCAFLSYAGVRRSIAERANVDGTGEVLELAEAASHLGQLVLWSSALIAGARHGRILEGELPSPPSFPSVVEETRFRAEAMVREAMDHVPTVILRPSIIVGDSRTGEIDRLEGPYLLVLLMLSSPVDLRVPLPGRGDVPLPLVPIDYVVEAGHAIANDPRAMGRTFHLVDPSPLTARRVFEHIARASGRPGPVGSLPTQLASAILRTPGLERFSHIPRAFLEQLAIDVTYDARNARELLSGTGIECPSAASYLTVMVDAVRSELERRAAEQPATSAKEEPEGEDPLA